jgi:hypothetical protein
MTNKPVGVIRVIKVMAAITAAFFIVGLVSMLGHAFGYHLADGEFETLCTRDGARMNCQRI